MDLLQINMPVDPWAPENPEPMKMENILKEHSVVSESGNGTLEKK